MAKREMKTKVTEETKIDETEVSKTEVSKTEVKTAEGIIANCSKVNIRKEPVKGDNVISVLEAGAKVTIIVEDGNPDWYKVVIKGKKTGYCMKKFISVKQ